MIGHNRSLPHPPADFHIQGVPEHHQLNDRHQKNNRQCARIANDMQKLLAGDGEKTGMNSFHKRKSVILKRSAISSQLSAFIGKFLDK